MGRTIPSFRIASVIEEKEWKSFRNSFRNSLDRSDRKKFDQMLWGIPQLTEYRYESQVKIELQR
jgi:hypothetical protein